MHVVCVSWPAQLTAACVNDSFRFLISVPSHLPWDADAQDRANELNRAVLHAQPGHSKIPSTAWEIPVKTQITTRSSKPTHWVSQNLLKYGCSGSTHF